MCVSTCKCTCGEEIYVGTLSYTWAKNIHFFHPEENCIQANTITTVCGSNGPWVNKPIVCLRHSVCSVSLKFQKRKILGNLTWRHQCYSWVQWVMVFLVYRFGRVAWNGLYTYFLENSTSSVKVLLLYLFINNLRLIL